MPWIPHVMVVDDDPRVLDSLIPSFADDLGRGLGQDPAVGGMLRRGDPAGGPARSRSNSAPRLLERSAACLPAPLRPHQVHLHLVRERGGRFDLARRLLNEQLFAVVVSDLRFSDDAGGSAGQLFVDKAHRVHPEVQGLLYSAYPRPEGFPAERFVRKGPAATIQEAGGELAAMVVAAVARHLAEPAVAAFARRDRRSGDHLSVRGVRHHSGPGLRPGPAARLRVRTPRSGGRSRRPLPCLLLDGESGTGKRGLAALFHAASDRRKAPMAVASCNELTNETLLRSILFGHKRGAFTDARDDRPGLVATAGKGVILLDDFHRLPTACTAILHSFLEDGEYSRLGEEEVRRQAEAAAVLTVETVPWLETPALGHFPLAFLARVERLPLTVPPLRERPDDIEAQARWLVRVGLGRGRGRPRAGRRRDRSLRPLPFAESNSRELRNADRTGRLSSQPRDRHDHLGAPSSRTSSPAEAARPTTLPATLLSARPRLRPRSRTGRPCPNEWQRRLRVLAAKILAKGTSVDPATAEALTSTLFDQVTAPALAADRGGSRDRRLTTPPIPWPVWEDLGRCFAVSWLGGPAPAERVLGIPANTLRQWINDRESR